MNAEVRAAAAPALNLGVDGDAPMGQLMRRHWAPLCLSEEVPQPDGAPRKPDLIRHAGIPIR